MNFFIHFGSLVWILFFQWTIDFFVFDTMSWYLVNRIMDLLYLQVFSARLFIRGDMSPKRPRVCTLFHSLWKSILVPWQVLDIQSFYKLSSLRPIHGNWFNGFFKSDFFSVSSFRYTMDTFVDLLNFLIQCYGIWIHYSIWEYNFSLSSFRYTMDKWRVSLIISTP